MSWRATVTTLATALALFAGGCGSSNGGSSTSARRAATQVDPVTSATTSPNPAPGATAQATTGSTKGFDPGAIYEREGPGVVTVTSILTGTAVVPGLGGGNAAVGSGFVISKDGEIATNAHVVTDGSGSNVRKAQAVYVRFGDGNQVSAKIIGADPFADVALLKIDPAGLSLHPLPLGSEKGLRVGSPVAAIGSPFGEEQSLSTGVISALNRTIESLTSFSISGAIQTDAAINHGNSGGPLVDAAGNVLGINSQIQSTGGGGEGVGFAVPVNMVRHSLDELRRTGKVAYAYIGVTSVTMYPQLAEHFKLPSRTGALVQAVTSGSPAQRAGIKAGSDNQRFQSQRFDLGGDLIVALDGQRILHDSDLGDAVSAHRPGDTVKLTLFRGKTRRTVSVKLGERPLSAPRGRRAP